jgi:EmrB/QacA subfamily drug resistance transporter
MTTLAPAGAAEDHLDPGRWVALVVVITAAFIVVLDNTILNVAIPTIVRDFNTTLPSVEWVITGYALTFATFLIIGGRLGDLYGHRRIFIIGAALFGAGSLLASVSTSVPQLVLGEAIIEGIGASLMLPTTLALLSVMFRGRERAIAFAAWGATAGVAAACGPVVGGFLTSNYSWRWSFRINVIIAPLAILGAMLFMKKSATPRRHVRIDIVGAILVASGMFLLVYALSQGSANGWWRPMRDMTVLGHNVWSGSQPVASTPVTIVIALSILATFVFYERAKERRHDDPLFEFAHLRYRTYRYGLMTGVIVALGQFGLSFVLPVFLQSARHLTPAQNGLWQLPTGLFIIFGAQVGGRLTRFVGTTVVVRLGLLSYVLGLICLRAAVSVHITQWQLLPGLAFYGIGIGFAGAQLTNVVLSEIPAESTGVASGANTTMRQVGAALGVATIGSILTAQIVSNSLRHINHVSVAAVAKAQALAGVHARGAFYTPSGSTSAHDASLLEHALQTSVASATRVVLLFAIIVVSIGLVVSFLIPRKDVVPEPEAVQGANRFEAVEPLDVDPALVEGHAV